MDVLVLCTKEACDTFPADLPTLFVEPNVSLSFLVHLPVPGVFGLTEVLSLIRLRAFVLDTLSVSLTLLFLYISNTQVKRKIEIGVTFIK